ncbi:TolC family protein [Leadbetterella sp. DM7]|uniref:TolC family protein n=1 Tax=Leadbetterella sp. DM7 TaxID=3235085 RepID=UPI00349EAEFF
MRRSILILVNVFIFFGGFAQDTVRLSRADAETLFLKENLLLIAEKMKVSEAEALVQQAKLWPNPNITVDQINLWATRKQTGGQEVVPPLWGSFGRNRQFGAELEQLIETAGKRKKEVAVEQVGVEKAAVEFRELLRGLKLELRGRMTGLQALEEKQKNEEARLASVRKLSQAYQNQVQQGNVPRNEVARLKALELEISRELREIADASFELQAGLKQLLKLDPAQVLLITDPLEMEVSAYRLLSPDQLIDTADRPDVRQAQLEETYYHKVTELERARRAPDVTLRAQYDRNGNAMLNFVGVGASVDLPLFNRNQGNIQYAQINARKAAVMTQQQTLTAQTEIVRAYRGFKNALDFYDTLEESYDRSLDELLDLYTRNFMNRNISMLEYLDFSDTYRNSKQIRIDAKRELREQFEKLNYASGRDL